MTLLRDCFGDISMINIQCAIGMMDAFGKDIIFSICLEKRERESRDNDFKRGRFDL